MGICTSKSSVKSNDQDGNNERVVPNPKENVNSASPTPKVPDPKPEQERQDAEGSPVAPNTSPNESITSPVAQGSSPHHEKAKEQEKQEEEVHHDKSETIDTNHVNLDPDAAATKIQAVFKGHQVRKNQHNLHKPLDDLHKNSSTPSSPDKEVVEEAHNINTPTKSDDEHSSIDPNEAATKIQAVFKGHQVRKNLKEHHETGHPDTSEAGTNKLIEIKEPTKTSNPDNAINQGDASHNSTGDSPIHHKENHELTMDEQEAATKIQAYFKGFKTRKELEKELHHHKDAS